MRIGFASIYAWRPHVEHMHYLSLLAQQAGHQVRFLACDGDLPSCYSRQLRPQNLAAWECLKCRAGSTRSFVAQGVSGIGSLASGTQRRTVDARFTAWAHSSANTLWRFETPADFESEEAMRTAATLAPAVSLAYEAARRWIEREALDGVYVFNGRMDVTRGVLEAARDQGLPFVSVERTWFGDGIALLPGEDCLGLKSIDRMVSRYSEVPLLKEQAARIARHVASRFLRVNKTEWRAYNQQATREPWPSASSGPRVLILPSSRNEFHSHPDWTNGWREPTQALDAVLDHLGLEGSDCVLRCHPNWGERIGHATGQRPERYYTAWAKERGINLIASMDRTSTLALIEQADAVVVNGSSAGLEAGVLGKQVISTGPSWYQASGYISRAYSPSDLTTLALTMTRDEATRQESAEQTARRALRFGFTMAARTPQFANQVRATNSLDYTYANGGDASRLARLLDTQRLDADDGDCGSSLEGEDGVLGAVRDRRWSDMLLQPPVGCSSAQLRVSRRRALQAVDRIRRAWPTGDR